MKNQPLREQIIRDIKEDIKLYCDKGIWSIDWTNVQYWLSNFKGNKEHLYFAYLLLDKIVFRTNKMLESAYKRFFATTIRHKINEISGKNFSIEEFFLALKNGSKEICPYFRIAPIRTEAGGESGDALLRHLNSNLIHERLNFKTRLKRRDWEKLSDDHLILVVDDFLGSGEQAGSFFKKYALETQYLNYFKSHKKLIFAPSLAMTNGIKNFKESFPNIALFPLEEVLMDQNVFEDNLDEPFGRDLDFSKKEAKKCYLEIKINNKIKIKDWCGRADSGLSIIFQLGVPNQSLALIFYSGDSWPLLQSRRSS